MLVTDYINTGKMFSKTLFLTSARNIVRFRVYSRVSISSSPLKEEKVKIGKYIINYMRVGEGPHNVFCAPGSLGTIWSDYKYQIEGFDRDKFSLIICDSAGSGKSIKPEDDNVINLFARDADVAYELMKTLEIPKYSFMGWSCGAVSGLILAGKHPEVINKLVVWGAGSHLLPSEVENYRRLKILNNWSKPALETMIKIYGKEDFIQRLNKWVDNIVDHSDTNIFSCQHLLKDIQCPTLILYGKQDQMVEGSHVDYLHKHIKNSGVYIYPEGKHNIHIRYAQDFNRRVQEFLLND